MRIRLRVNGTDHDLDVHPGDRLLAVLRDRLGLTGSKNACGVGECGACTVLVGGSPHLACVTLAATVDDDVVTVEGVDDVAAGVREAFAEQGGFQCGFCTPGQIMSCAAFVTGRRACGGDVPAEDDVRAAMTGNVCRCTGYGGVVRSVQQAAAVAGPGRPSTGEEG